MGRNSFYYGRCGYLPHRKGRASFQKVLETRNNKKILSVTLVELVEVVLKNNIFQTEKWIFNFKEVCTSLCWLEKMSQTFERKPMVCRRYIDEIFFI